MSNFKSGAPQTQLAQARPQDGIQALLRRNWDRIASVMPKHMTSERLFQLSVSAINQTPKLAACTPVSLLSCVMKCSALGLEPSAVDGLGRAYILPYGNQATFILGYKGIIDLARRSGQLKSIHAQAVYEGDEFDFWEDEEGQHFKFRPARDIPHDKDHLTEVYMTAHLLDGGLVFERMTVAEVEAIRKRSRAKNNGPWVTDFEAMALKSVIRRAARYLPMSTQAQEAVAADEQTPDYSGVLDPVLEVVPDAPMEPQQPEFEVEAVATEEFTEQAQTEPDFGSQAPVLFDDDLAPYDMEFPGE